VGEHLLKSVGTRKALAEKLERCSDVARHGKEEAWSIAYSLGDIEQSMRTFLGEQLPALLDPGVEGEKLEDLLLEVREEFRHILYHIHDPEFFRVVEPTHDWLALSEGKKAQNQ
jgi:hypothetical protein